MSHLILYRSIIHVGYLPVPIGTLFLVWIARDSSITMKINWRLPVLATTITFNWTVSTFISIECPAYRTQHLFRPTRLIKRKRKQNQLHRYFNRAQPYILTVSSTHACFKVVTGNSIPLSGAPIPSFGLPVVKGILGIYCTQKNDCEYCTVFETHIVPPIFEKRIETKQECLNQSIAGSFCNQSFLFSGR